MGKKNYIKTISIVIILIIIISLIHFINHLKIQQLEYTDKWGDELELKELDEKEKNFLSNIDDELLSVTIEDENLLNFQILDINGKLKENGSTQLDNYINIKVNDIKLVENKLIYLYEDDVYFTELNDNKFTNTKKIIKNVDNMNVERNKENIIITTINEENIRVFELDNTQVKNIYEVKNDLDLKDAFYQKINNKEYIFSISNDGYGNEKLIMIPTNNEESELVIREVNNNTGYKIKDFNIDYLDEKIIITYILNLNYQGIQSNDIEYSIIDFDTFEIENKKIDHSMYKIGNLESDIETYIVNNELHIVGSGLNYDNKYTKVNDIFDFTMEKNGNIKGVEFISTTQRYSNEVQISQIKDNVFMTYKDIITKGSKLNFIGTSDEFINRDRDNISYYKSSLIRSIPSPLIAMSYTLLRGFILMVMLLVPIAILYIVYLKKDSENDKIKAGIIIGIYIIINIIAHNFLYYEVGNGYYYPEILFNKSYQILIPIVINLLSGIVLYVFSKEISKNNIEVSYFILSLVFIVMDIYLNNILYAPFLMVGKLI
ncbi:hypothetical protein GOQ29_06180 [Clostridium sp. D2Q-14]|uniref:hypothetical protein n=1 Tax=Anaeromonas gelatinilytica TaxID=2683194 RepID=UPI00193BA183|nr:hypothetical protein [Anaeromonas gelatinilytica]MBS4535207.1 hypothetical protein [Anaeromonas gelatinilytica]